ncbi:MAG: NADH-quinone oxidoreductase subunit L [Candidatus Methanodesulfokora sp.]|jgi:NADH-quinone oxidoreductase subunit L
MDYAFLAWEIPYVGAVLSLLLNKIGKIRDLIAVIAILASAVFSTLALQEVLASDKPIHVSYRWIESLNITFGVYLDSLSGFMALIVAWLSFLIAAYSLEYMSGDPGLTRYWFFFDFFVGSMMLLVLADNLILMFLGWEGTGLASYALIGHWYTDEDERCVGDIGRRAFGTPMWFTPSHSGLRAIVFTRLGDVGFVLGIGVLYYLTRTFSIPEIAEKAGEWVLPLAESGLLLPFLLAFSLGALAKSAQFPFHEWLVTAMTGPTSVSALIHAATMVKAGVYFLLRFSPIFALAAREVPAAAAHVQSFFVIIALIGSFTAFLMASQALVSRELKLILAFSTASQLGYMFLAIGAAGLIPEFQMGFLACFSHLMSHAIFKASLFLSAGAIIHAVHSRFIDEMGGLWDKMKWSFLAMSLAALSLMGVPPFMGFWTKDMVIEVSKESGVVLAYVLGLITAGFTAFYSTRMIARTFLVSSHHEHRVHEAHPLMLLPYLVLSLISLILGLIWPVYGPELLSSMTEKVLGIHGTLHMEIHLDPALLITTLSIVSIGIIVALYTYLTERGKHITGFVSESSFCKSIYNFLYDRWYINALYYKLIVKGFSLLSSGIFKYFDSLVIDGFYHSFIPWITDKLSSLGFKYFETDVVDETYHNRIVKMFNSVGSFVRKLQTGLINQYLVTFILGLLVVLLILLWVG